MCDAGDDYNHYYVTVILTLVKINIIWCSNIGDIVLYHETCEGG